MDKDKYVFKTRISFYMRVLMCRYVCFSILFIFYLSNISFLVSCQTLETHTELQINEEKNTLTEIVRKSNGKLNEKKVFTKDRKNPIEIEEYDADGQISHKIFFRENGRDKHWEGFFEKSNLIKEIVYNNYGSIHSLSLLENNIRQKKIIYDEYGKFPKYMAEFWPENGQEKHSLTYLRDGSSLETFHWLNGNVRTKEFFEPDRMTKKYIKEYNEAGILKHHIYYREDGITKKSEAFYMQEDIPLLQKFYTENGRGLIIQYTYWPENGYKRTSVNYKKNGEDIESLLCYSQTYKDVVVKCQSISEPCPKGSEIKCDTREESSDPN